MNAFLRRRFLPIHRWAALTIGLVLLWMALTGAGMVFRPQLAPLLDRDLLVVAPCTSPLPIDALIDTARAAHPDGRLNYIWIRPQSSASAMLRFADNATLYLDPCTGALLGEQHKYGSVFGRLEQWHRFKFIKNGSLIAGTSVLVAVVVLLLGGALLWWSSRRAIADNALRIRAPLSERARSLRRHRTIGIYACLIILASALTGLPKSFGWYHDAILALAGSPPDAALPRSSSIDESAPRISMEAAWQRVQSMFSETVEARLYIPAKAGAAIEVELLERSAPHPEALSLISLDAQSGDVIEARPYAASSAGSKLLGWMLAWHKGTLGGVFGQIILLAGALAVVFLAYTGIGSYLRRRSSSKASRRRYAS